MKVDDLKSHVLRILGEEPISIRQIMINVNSEYDKQYAYTTISTILNRLENDGMVISKALTTDKRKPKVYSLSKSAYRQEVSKLLRSLIFKFGPTGIRHLGEALDREISDDEIQMIFDKLNL